MQVDLVSVHALVRDPVPYRIKCSEFTPVIAGITERRSIDDQAFDLLDYIFSNRSGTGRQITSPFTGLGAGIVCNQVRHDSPSLVSAAGLEPAIIRLGNEGLIQLDDAPYVSVSLRRWVTLRSSSSDS